MSLPSKKSRTQINAKARKEIARISEENNWQNCMIRLEGCMTMAHAPAHRHKRVWYRGQPDELLWDVKEWMPACQSCHTKIEHDKSLTEEVFNKWLDSLRELPIA